MDHSQTKQKGQNLLKIMHASVSNKSNNVLKKHIPQQVQDCKTKPVLPTDSKVDLTGEVK